jgi:hypothetical protein
MKTKVRIIIKDEGMYKHFIINVLYNRFKDSSYLEIAGNLTWQTDTETLSNSERRDKWYALNYKIESDRLEHFEYMIKLIRYIDKNAYHNIQPNEMLNLIGAEEYVIHNYDFVPVSYSGMNLYDIIDLNKDTDNVWTRIYAPNDIVANKETDKLSEKNNTTYNYKLKEERVKLESNLINCTLPI